MQGSSIGNAIRMVKTAKIKTT